MSQDEKSQPGLPCDSETVAGSTEAHQKLVYEILKEYGSLSYLRLWKNSTGTAKSLEGNRFIKFGLKSSSDILGIHYPTGKLVAIEVKTGNSKPTKGQKAFRAMIRKFCGIYILARSTSDVYNALVLNRHE